MFNTIRLSNQFLIFGLLSSSCQYGERCKFLHVIQQQPKSNAFGFGTQATSHQQQKPNPFGFGVQNNAQSKGVNDFGNKQSQFKVKKLYITIQSTCGYFDWWCHFWLSFVAWNSWSFWMPFASIKGYPKFILFFFSLSYCNILFFRIHGPDLLQAVVPLHCGSLTISLRQQTIGE